MKNLIEKDKKRRYLYAINEKKYFLLKYLTNNVTLSKEIRQNAQINLSKLSLDGSRVKIGSRCILTGRSRAVYKKFKISRLMLRKLALAGELTGIKKISW